MRPFLLLSSRFGAEFLRVILCPMQPLSPSFLMGEGNQIRQLAPVTTRIFTRMSVTALRQAGNCLIQAMLGTNRQ